jgi:hypothetical protein
LEKVGMDIRFGHANSPGGFIYSPLIVDYKTRKKFIYGMKDVSGDRWCPWPNTRM